MQNQAGPNNVEIGDPIYDGELDWTLESIDLSDFLGEENLVFRFDLFSDGFINGDGINIDDLSFQITEAEPNATSSQLEASVSVFPNPAQGNLNVWFNTILDKPLSYIIFNSLGQNIVNGRILGQKNTINIQALDNGLYTIRLFEEEGAFTSQKFIKLN